MKLQYLLYFLYYLLAYIIDLLIIVLFSNWLAKFPRFQKSVLTSWCELGPARTCCTDLSLTSSILSQVREIAANK